MTNSSLSLNKFQEEIEEKLDRKKEQRNEIFTEINHISTRNATAIHEAHLYYESTKEEIDFLHNVFQSSNTALGDMINSALKIRQLISEIEELERQLFEVKMKILEHEHNALLKKGPEGWTSDTE